jgi:hypothetical protein
MVVVVRMERLKEDEEGKGRWMRDERFGGCNGVGVMN